MKGMQKIKRGTGFRGCAEYLLDHDGGRVVGGNMTGSDPRALAREFAVSRQLRPEIEKPVWHNSLRLPVDERVVVDDAKWRQIADDYMRAMGFTDEHPRVYVRHDPDHLHILASRVSIGGEVYLGRNENLRSTVIIQRLEHVHGLTVTKGPEKGLDGKIKAPDARRVKPGERRLYERTGNEPPREQLQRLVAEAAKGKPTASEFVGRLREQGISVRANVSQSTGRLAGFSFALDGVAFTGKQLGDKFTWSRLKKAGVSYDPARDHDTLLQRKTPEQRATPALVLRQPEPTGPKKPAAGLELRPELPENALSKRPRPEKKQDQGHEKESTVQQQHFKRDEVKVEREDWMSDENYQVAIQQQRDRIELEAALEEYRRIEQQQKEQQLKSRTDWGMSR